ncbi:DnaT-like ssDNA-binding domain-containing protein [Bowmanella denitrificans]|uniref:DnaT-like ssDNA-binding domain-containing protein n=1 Tax=Bowmanella denitrificans TaxID=366582 RepID=UPI000C9C40CF|nr:DnaT-like ssDNA-binding domain-containing protein [Bowmanella denitrificans]
MQQFERSAMAPDWQPDPDQVEQIATMVGLLNKEFDATDVGEFVAYWMGRPEIYLNSYQWHHKFVQNLKHKRTAWGKVSQSRVGTQMVSNTEGLTTCDNTRQLLDRYAKHK